MNSLGVCRLLSRNLSGRRTLFSVAAIDKPVVVVGVVDAGDKFDLTPTGHKLNQRTDGQLVNRLTGPVVKEGTSRLLGSLHPDLGPVVAVGLGKAGRGVDAEEDLDVDREAVRKAAAAGVRAATVLESAEVQLEDFGDIEAAAEGAILANWRYDQFKSDKKKPLPTVSCLEDVEGAGWQVGKSLGEAQNLARRLMEAPANFLTPTQFCEEAIQELSGLNVDMKVRDKKWAEDQGMGSFLSVSAGSAEPPMFLEMNYNGGGDSAPVVLVGKGVTFDTGGISIKPSSKMDAMRADMGGAATVTATIKAVAQLNIPVNLVVLVPLTENMPGSKATKPGDVVTAKNGVTIQVDNTDAEGRLILADALCYADTFNPRHVVDVATLTGAMSVALGTAATGVFSTKTEDFVTISQCGRITGDRMWRMPLWNHYTDKMKKSPLADLNNISLTPGGGSCTAAAFLKQFTTCPSWLHLDIAGVMDNSGDVSYLGNGMSGRPTRTLVKYVEKLSIK